MKTCTKCNVEKPLDEYNRRQDGKFGRRADCKPCARERGAEYRDRREVRQHQAEQQSEYRARPEVKVRKAEYNAEYYAENRDEMLEAYSQYRRENPHVAWESHYGQRAESFGFTPVIESFTKNELIDRYGNKCFHCGGPFEQLDHNPIAIAHGGAHTLSNTKPSCTYCCARQVFETVR